MTSSPVLGPPFPDDDELTSWEAEPSPAHPHVALLLGGSLLTVDLVCVLPNLVVGCVRPGPPMAIFLAMVIIAAVCGIGPFVSTRLQSLNYVAYALLVFNVIPLVVVAVQTEHSPARQWASLILIPVLLTAATANRRFYQAQLAAGCTVGLAIMSIAAPSVAEGVLTCLAYLFFMLVCARLVRQDWAALHRQFVQLQLRSRTDDLTGLLNRRGFVAQFPDLRRRAMEAGSPLGMVMIDIDHFSRINAEHGHAYGDAVLQRICALVLAQPGVPDGVVARIGGEELVVVVPQPAAAIAESIHEAVARALIHPGLTVSMGICDSDAAACVGPESLWRLVNFTDSAMYRAKESGRNRIVHAEMPTRTQPGPVVESDAWPEEPEAAGLIGEQRVPLSGNLGAARLADEDLANDSRLDYRLFGGFCLAFGIIGATAYLAPVAIDPGSPWASVFLALLAVVAVFGMVAVSRGRALSDVVATLGFLSLEICTITAVLATTALEHRLMIICIIAVPMLIAAHSLPRAWLVSQYLLVFCGAGLAARVPGVPIDAAWVHRTLSVGVVLSAAPAVLFWLRERRRVANQRMRELTAIDPLTGLRNRSGLERNALLHQPTERLHVLSINIDGFKSINDTFGHVYGDQALVSLADTLTTAVRDHEMANRPAASALPSRVPGGHSRTTLARTGGDRFVMANLCPVDPALLRRVRRSVTQMPIELSISFGQAEGPATTSAELWVVVATADADLARSKQR